jgi:hypothetical protein
MGKVTAIKDVVEQQPNLPHAIQGFNEIMYEDQAIEVCVITYLPEHRQNEVQKILDQEREKAIANWFARQFAERFEQALIF